MKRLRVCLIVTLALLLITVSVAGAGGNANPGVLPPNSRVQGLTYGEWSTVWWRYALTIPTPQNPLLGNYGPDCYFAQTGNVGLALATAATTELACEVPAGMQLFVITSGAECSTLEPPPFYGENEEELRACAKSWGPVDLQVSIDDVSVQNLGDYLVTSPLYQFTVPDDNILGVPAGSVGQSVSYGHALMLKPLTPGQHTILIYCVYPDGFVVDATFHITVTTGH
jgi:hypothetical protein